MTSRPRVAGADAIPETEGQIPARDKPAAPPDLAAQRHRHERRQQLLVVGGWLAVLAIVGGAWQFSATQGLVDPVFTGKPTSIAQEFWTGVTGTLVTVDARTTVTAALIGYFGAATVGILSAFAISQSPVARRVIEPYFTAFNGLPRVALAPLFILWFGIGISSKIALTASLTYFVTFYNTMAGIDGVDRDHVVLAKALGASRLQLFRKFVVPSAIPSIFAGLQLGLVYGMLGTVAGEMLAGQHGLGVVLTRQASLFQTDAYFGTLLLLALVTTALTLVLEAIRLRLLRWQHAHLTES